MTSITAQLSLYPLRKKSLSPSIDKSLEILRAYNLDFDPGIMSTLIIGEDNTVFAALEEIFHALSEQGDVVMASTISNACPVPPRCEEVFTYKAIGHVKNSFEEPVNPDLLRAAESDIILDPDLIDGLEGLEAGQRVLVLFAFHLVQGYHLLQHPQGDPNRAKRGVFTLRSPHRPNPIGYCEVDLLAIEKNILHVRGLDALNNTPVLDLKLI